MASELDDHGQIKRDKNGNSLKGIEDYLPGKQYDNDDHRERVVESILKNYKNDCFWRKMALFSMESWQQNPLQKHMSIGNCLKRWLRISCDIIIYPNINVNSASVF